MSSLPCFLIIWMCFVLVLSMIRVRNSYNHLPYIKAGLLSVLATHTTWNQVPKFVLGCALSCWAALWTGMMGSQLEASCRLLCFLWEFHTIVQLHQLVSTVTGLASCDVTFSAKLTYLKSCQEHPAIFTVDQAITCNTHSPFQQAYWAATHSTWDSLCSANY